MAKRTLSAKKAVTWVTSAPLAAHLGCSARWITQCVTEGKISAPKNGKFNLDEACREYHAKKKVEKSGNTTERFETNRADLYAERVRKAKWEADLIEGKCLHLNAIREVNAERHSNMKGRLLSIPSKVAPIVADISDPAACFKAINDAIYEALAELSDPSQVEVYVQRYREIASAEVPNEEITEEEGL